MNNIVVTIHIDDDSDMLEDVQMVAPDCMVSAAAGHAVRFLQDKYSKTRDLALIIKELESLGFVVCEELVLIIGYGS